MDSREQSGSLSALRLWMPLHWHAPALHLQYSDCIKANTTTVSGHVWGEVRSMALAMTWIQNNKKKPLFKTCAVQGQFDFSSSTEISFTGQSSSCNRKKSTCVSKFNLSTMSLLHSRVEVNQISEAACTRQKPVTGKATWMQTPSISITPVLFVCSESCLFYWSSWCYFKWGPILKAILSYSFLLKIVICRNFFLYPYIYFVFFVLL